MQWDITDTVEFLSTLSLRRATGQGPAEQDVFVISIHALLAESDSGSERILWPVMNFYPRSPCGERQQKRCLIRYSTFHFYPRSPCGERPAQKRYHGSPTADFYPRSPCGERRILGRRLWHREQFLSTLSLRRATHFEITITDIDFNFYPRSPCGERLPGT